MRLIICGGRDFADHELFHTAITDWIVEHDWPTVVITGGATGADELGKQFAKTYKIKHVEYPADWKKHGGAAGPKRNGVMAAYAAAGMEGGCLALPGGRGTADMCRQAEAAGLIVTKVQP
ncbi:DUF2493 domain-containing protein [Deinococcus oregonensis]|uniref:DUF2493 domain-containing protein n=1 Tax=Deinococcus oregonensis TaxID=1805970 RepID=A0ABV6AVQ1_9DEIO